MATKPTIEEMRAMIAAADRKSSEDGLPQLDAMIADDCWSSLKEAVQTACTAYSHSPMATLHLKGLATALERVESLPDQIRKQLT